MACNSITALPRACGTAGILAGVEELYMISYNDLVAATAAVAGEKYTRAVGGLINDIGVAVGKTFVKIGTLKSAVGLNSAMTKNAQNGTAYYKPTMSLALSDMSLDNESFVNNVMFQPVAVLVKARTGKWFATGLNGQFELSAAESGLGIAEGDDYGYKLTFEGLEVGPLMQVDPTIINGLIS